MADQSVKGPISKRRSQERSTCLSWRVSTDHIKSDEGLFFNPLVPIVTYIIFLLMISIHCQEIRLWELVKWSPSKRKCFDLYSEMWSVKQNHSSSTGNLTQGKFPSERNMAGPEKALQPSEPAKSHVRCQLKVFCSYLNFWNQQVHIIIIIINYYQFNSTWRPSWCWTVPLCRSFTLWGRFRGGLVGSV